MRIRYVIAIVWLSTQLTGCSWVRKLWPWGGDADVPVTRPTSEDANVPITPAPAAPPVAPPVTPAARAETLPSRAPGGTPVAAAAKPKASDVINRPTNLTDLLYGRKAVAATATQPAATQPVAAPPPIVAARVATTQPAGRADRPPKRGDEPIGRTILPAGGRPTPVGPERVVAASALQVNRRFITVDDVLRHLRPRLTKVPKTIPLEAFRQRVAPWVAEEIREQINHALVLEEANKRLTDEQKKIVDTEVTEARNAMLAEAGGSVTKLRRTLAKQGTTLEQVLTEHREDTLFRFYLRSRFMPAIVITRKMLWDYYRIHSKEFTVETKVQMQIIAAPFQRFLPEKVPAPSATERQAARTKAKETIDQALAALVAGQDFGKVAKQLSRGIKAKYGGVWPLMAANSFRETAVEQAAFRLEEGHATGPIETDSGFYIVKVRRRQQGRVVPFEEAQEKISETLRNRLYLEQTQKYFRDLYEKALIRRSDEFQIHALNRAAEEHFRK